MVGDDGDVLVALAVTGLIDADADEPVEAPRRIRLQIPKGSGDAAADGLPVDQEEMVERGRCVASQVAVRSKAAVQLES